MPDRWLHFNARVGDLAQLGARQLGFEDWTDEAANLQVTGWPGVSPKLNGRPLVLPKEESARSVAVALGRVLVGTDWYLSLFDSDAQAIWKRPVALPSAAMRVNQSSDGRVAVAALQDGTIRWYRTSDGVELLALFVTRDSKRWIAFTPTGYYSASPGGEDLFGWHVNRGPLQEADFFPAARFRERYYRPDVIKLVLNTLDEGKAGGDRGVRIGLTTELRPGFDGTVGTQWEGRVRRRRSGTPVSRWQHVLARQRYRFYAGGANWHPSTQGVNLFKSKIVKIVTIGALVASALSPAHAVRPIWKCIQVDVDPGAYVCQVVGTAG